MKRRDVLRGVAGFAGCACIPRVADGPPPQASASQEAIGSRLAQPTASSAPSLGAAVSADVLEGCSTANVVRLGTTSISPHLWPDAFDAAALIDVDDLCPVFLPGDGLDFGGNMTTNGIVRGFLVDQLLARYPSAKIALMTIANMKLHPLTNGSLGSDDRYLLSRNPKWCEDVRGVIQELPNISLAMHGYTHYNSTERSARELLQYDADQTTHVLELMRREFAASLPFSEPVFRAPGWDTTVASLRYLAENRIVLADSNTSQTFSTPSLSCLSVGGATLLREGPDFTLTVKDGLQRGEYLVLHLHFTAPNVNNLGTADARQVALVFAREISTQTRYRVIWLSYFEAARSVARARAAKWDASVINGDILIDVREAARGVTLSVDALGARNVLIRRDGVTARTATTRSARGVDYVVLA